jgi:hypothetical protein
LVYKNEELTTSHYGYGQFLFGVPFKHLKLITTNQFGDHITLLDMAAATSACKDAYKAWCQAKGKNIHKDWLTFVTWR